MHREPTVLVEHVDVDAALVKNAGEDWPILVLRAEQTIENAVRVTKKLLPFMHPDQVRAMVRRHMPEAPELGCLLETPPSPLPLRDRQSAAKARVAALTAAAMMLVGGVGAIAGVLLHDNPKQFSAAPVVSNQMPPDALIDDDFTRRLGMTGGICAIDRINSGSCIIPGFGKAQVWLAARTTGVAYILDFGEELSLLVIYDPSTPDAAERFGHRPSTQNTYRHIAIWGPYVVLGSSQKDVASFRDLLAAGGPLT